MMGNTFLKKYDEVCSYIDRRCFEETENFNQFLVSIFSFLTCYVRLYEIVVKKLHKYYI